MAAKKEAPRGRAPGQGETGDETNIACSPGDALVQARYWYRVVRAHQTEVTVRGFCETVALLSPGQGGEARYLIKEAKRLQREIDKQTWKSVKLTMRSAHAKAFILGWENGALPIVRGYVSRSGTLCRCPWCGNPEQHPANWTDDQITVWCLTYWGFGYVIRFERTPPLIPAYIPTRETGR